MLDLVVDIFVLVADVLDVRCTWLGRRHRCREGGGREAFCREGGDREAFSHGGRLGGG